MFKKIVLFMLISPCLCAEEDLSIQEWLDIFIDSCVGSGTSYIVSGSVDAGLGLSLKKFSASGNLEGKVKITKSSYRLLSEGISNAMSDTAANQADKVRDCLSPVRRNLLIAMNQQMGNVGSIDPGFQILSPYEESVMKILASSKGPDGSTGKYIKRTSILRESGLSDVRMRVVVRMLVSKRLVNESPYIASVDEIDLNNLNAPDAVGYQALSLEPRGEEYVLDMGYVQ